MGANTKNTKAVSEVGVIGKTYQNRKTKKLGVLESRDEKYKTLIMRDPDGKTFNIVYSTFRSDWRSYDGDNAVETSTQKEEKKEAAVKEQKKEKLSKSEKAERDRKKVEAVKLTYEAVEAAIAKNKVEHILLKKNTRGAVIVKYNRRTVVEIWTLSDGCAIRMNYKVKFSDKAGAKSEPKPGVLTERYVVTNLAAALADIMPVLKADVDKKVAEAKNVKKDDTKNDTKNTNKKGE